MKKHFIKEQLVIFTILIVVITVFCMIAYNETRQVNICALSSKIEWIQFVNGLGQPVSGRHKKVVRTYWNELGRKYAKIHLLDGREFDLHYFHSDTGNRRRVWIEVDVDDKTDTAILRLLYGDKEMASSKYPISEIVGTTVDLMALMKSQQEK